MKTGIELITNEREEQLFKHKYTVQGDIQNNNEYQLLDAANALMMPVPEGFEEDYLVNVHGDYPPIGWNKDIWVKMLKKPLKERLVIAGALISAQIDVENKKP